MSLAYVVVMLRQSVASVSVLGGNLHCAPVKDCDCNGSHRVQQSLWLALMLTAAHADQSIVPDTLSSTIRHKYVVSERVCPG